MVYCKITIFELSYRNLQPKVPMGLRGDQMRVKLNNVGEENGIDIVVSRNRPAS